MAFVTCSFSFVMDKHLGIHSVLIKKLSENCGVHLKHNGHRAFRVGRRLLKDCEKLLKDNYRKAQN